MSTFFKIKQVIVIRKDLKMGLGKAIVQACHASVEASEVAKKMNPDIWRTWMDEGAKKVVVKVTSLEELLELEKKCKSYRLPVALVVDRGLTQIPPNTPTALAIGPAYEADIDKLTGELKLL
ncbi:MAG: peptidyl-tRNA hydrolase Pth2 [Candidatus Bathyarchaeia archaeon]